MWRKLKEHFDELMAAVVFLVWILTSILLGEAFILHSEESTKVLKALATWIVWSVFLVLVGWSIYKRIAEWKAKMEKAIEDIEKKLDAILERLD